MTQTSTPTLAERLQEFVGKPLKVFGTELRIEATRLLMEVLGPEATIQKGSPRALFDGLFEVQYRGAIVGTFGGGVNEVQREIIGAAGLGMPRVPR